jgi:hypothetical protein
MVGNRVSVIVRESGGSDLTKHAKLYFESSHWLDYWFRCTTEHRPLFEGRRSWHSELLIISVSGKAAMPFWTLGRGGKSPCIRINSDKWQFWSMVYKVTSFFLVLARLDIMNFFVLTAYREYLRSRWSSYSTAPPWPPCRQQSTNYTIPLESPDNGITGP